jgi:superfamily II DNA or RNA helicase
MSRVRHPVYGPGSVLVARDDVITVEFDSGTILKVPASEVEQRARPEDAVAEARYDEPLLVLLRSLAAAIRSTNDRWGVFSPSRIALLPHQLWVCHQVLRRWPSRWLVADDVGLGKTIEAGLILTPLLGRGHVRRLLVVCPAGLVNQWVERLHDMFQINALPHSSALEAAQPDFWSANDQVVASLQTIRMDHNGRWDRMLAAEPWDLVLIDEAHHLNTAEEGTKTLGLQLIEAMEKHEMIGGLLLFTGTPHRGKDRGFLSLLHLLDDTIDPKKGLEDYVDRLPGLMIRNNKQNVTDLHGERLFQPVAVHSVLYSHSPAEDEFHKKLREFIVTGRAYAGEMKDGQKRSVMLVLIAMQKLAASSIAAIRRALANRLDRLREASRHEASRQQRMSEAWAELEQISQDESPETADRRAALEERIGELMEGVQLNPDEIPAVEELLELAEAVGAESRVDAILAVIRSFPPTKKVLLFTEYKATQALVVNALCKEFGHGQALFINGDERLPGALGVDGRVTTLSMARAHATRCFNEGNSRFLVSTEAAGEGIDLQHRCHTLIHVDLPWNPMRMHQRVGRVNRFGQREAVEVYLVRNPDTVEARIWSKLEEKLDRIALAFEGAMSDPEDIRALVLGALPANLQERLTAEALGVENEAFDTWFDSASATFGGRDFVSVVNALIGSAARFDFQACGQSLPRVDLKDLQPFLVAALRWQKRRPDMKDGVLSFRTPEEWERRHIAIRQRYEVHFDRNRPGSRRGPTIVGAGHRLIEVALDSAEEQEVFLSAVPDLSRCVVVYTCQDEFSAPSTPLHRAVVGAEKAGDDWRPLVDWQLVSLLNPLVAQPDRAALRQVGSVPGAPSKAELDGAFQAVARSLDSLDLPFKRPVLRLHSVLVPK